MDGRIDAGWIAMLSLVLAVLSSLAAGFHVRRNLVLENLALRHQLLVLKRSIKNPALRNLRPAFLGRPQCDVVAVDEGVGDRPTANSRPLASGGIPAFLALAITTALGSHPEGS